MELIFWVRGIFQCLLDEWFRNLCFVRPFPPLDFLFSLFLTCVGWRQVRYYLLILFNRLYAIVYNVICVASRTLTAYVKWSLKGDNTNSFEHTSIDDAIIGWAHRLGGSCCSKWSYPTQKKKTSETALKVVSWFSSPSWLTEALRVSSFVNFEAYRIIIAANQTDACTCTQPAHGSSQSTEKWHLLTSSRELRYNWLQRLRAEAALFVIRTINFPHYIVLLVQIHQQFNIFRTPRRTLLLRRHV